MDAKQLSASRRLPAVNKSLRPVTRCARKKSNSRKLAEPAQPDPDLPAWKQDLALLQQKVASQHSAAPSSGQQTVSRPQPQPQPAKQARAPLNFRRRDSLNAFSADSGLVSSPSPSQVQTSESNPRTFTQQLPQQSPQQLQQDVRTVPSGTGFGKKAVASPKAGAAASPAASSQGSAPPVGLSALRENFLPPAGAAELRQNPQKRGISFAGSPSPPNASTRMDPTAAGIVEDSSTEFRHQQSIGQQQSGRGFGQSRAQTGTSGSQSPGRSRGVGFSRGNDEVMEEVLSVGLDDWPDDEDDDSSGWVDVSQQHQQKSRKSAAGPNLSTPNSQIPGRSSSYDGSSPLSGSPQSDSSIGDESRPSFVSLNGADEDGPMEEVLSVGLDDWPDDDDDGSSGWVDVGKHRQNRQKSSTSAADSPQEDLLKNIVFSNEDGWSVEDPGIGSGIDGLIGVQDADADVETESDFEPEPYAVEQISQTANLPAPDASPHPALQKTRKSTRRRDAVARTLSSRGPAPTTEPTLAAQLAAVPALSRLSPHEIRALEKMQLETTENNASVKAIAARKKVAARKTHRRLHIMGGRLQGRSLLSGDAETTRPMMEMVRQAVFNMLLAQADGPSHVELPAESRWLDLFAGTGAVGLEALSRGCGHASFVELDSWVVDKVLEPNLDSCGLMQQASIHCMRAEDFVRRAAAGNSVRGLQAFDYISVCPPYLQVSYPELFDLLESSSLIHDNTIVILEYPKQLRHEIRDQLGPLHKIRDRRYGRTLIAVYGPE